MKTLIPFLILSCFCLACAPTKNSISNRDIGNGGTTLTDKGLVSQQNLTYYLTRTAGINLIGNNFVVNGQEPIYVVNGKEVGRSFELASDLVRDMEIKSVKMLTHIEANSQFGLRGACGVVNIKAVRSKSL